MFEDPAKRTDGSAFQMLLDGDMATLARAITVLESGGAKSDALVHRIRDYTGSARVLAFTGPPGAGKSTLINAYITELRQRDHRVAVLAVDPSSPMSGGSVLGDRTRMGKHSTDPGVFIRSVASRGHLGGLSLSIPAILDAVDAAGWNTIILETVGAGQSETEIAEFADIKIVLNAPGLGDDVQAIKAGILEIADILVVNKCDLPLADRTVRQLQSMLELRKAEWRNVPIIATSATNEIGLSQLDEAIAARIRLTESESTEIRRGRRLIGLLRRRAEALLKDQLDLVPQSQLDEVCSKVRQGTITVESAAMSLAASALAVRE